MAKTDNKKTFGLYSRLRFYSTVIDEDKNVIRLGMRNKRFITRLKEQASYTNYNVPAQYAYRPDLIANEFYGIPELWWVITEFNEIFHPAKELTINKQLRVPTQQDVFNLLI